MSFSHYTDYKDTGIEWLSEVPTHWEQYPLFALMQEKCEKNVGNKVRNVLSLSYGRIVDRNVESNDGLLPESFETYQIVQCNNIVLRLTDLQNDQRSLRVGRVTKEGIITSAYLCLELSDRIVPSFSYLLLHSYDLKKVFYGLGGGVRQSMKFEALKRLPIFLPPYNEQHSIATFIDRETTKIDTLVAEQERLITLLKEKRQAVISHAVTKGLDSTISMKYFGTNWLDEVPEHWTITKVKFISKFVTSGSRGWAQYYSEFGSIFIRSGNFSDHMTIDMDLRDVQYVLPPAGSEGERTQVQPNDVLVSITGYNIGASSVIPEGIETAYVNQHTALIRPNITDINPRFLAYTIAAKYCQMQIRMLTQGGTKEGITLDDVRSLTLLVPPKSEQDLIVEHLDRNGKLTNEAMMLFGEQAQLLSEYHQAVISSAVTGKIDVRGLVEEVAAV